jgi:DNA-binding response OmpR family regulator
MQILLVEDDETVADAIVRMMALNDFQVCHTNNTQDAQAAFQNHHFILAIVDIGLPGADGLTFVRRIRKEGSKMPVLILTARHALREKLNAFELGADDYLMKPFDLAELLARCRALVRRYADIMTHRMT